MYSSRGGEPELDGLPEEVAERIRADLHQREEIVDVWPENHEAVSIFSQCATQWRIGVSGPTGLDYTAVFGVMEASGVSEPMDCLWRIQAMEAEALRVLTAS